MKVKKIPLRKCVGSGVLKPKNELLRIVALPSGGIELDITGKKPGRGVYICNDIECFKKAYESHALEKALKRPVPREVYEDIRVAIENG